MLRVMATLPNSSSKTQLPSLPFRCNSVADVLQENLSESHFVCEPNNAGNNEDCAILLKTGVWNDENCDNKHRTVLKYGPDVPAEGGHDEL